MRQTDKVNPKSNKSHYIPVIGILGGIASGKSTIAGMFERLGCVKLDADKIAHELIEKEDIKEVILSEFGRDLLDSAGHIDKKKLAQRAFDGVDTAKRLNAIVHPPVMERIKRRIAEIRQEGRAAAIVLDAPLLLEAGGQDLCDALVFVDADPQIRLQRWLKTKPYDAEELKKRENLQISLDKKRKIAHYIIQNNSDASEVAEQVAQLLSGITSGKA